MNRAVLAGLYLMMSAAAFAFDAGEFEPATLKNFQRQQPAATRGREWIFDAAMPGLAVGFRYTGTVRPIPGPRAKQIEEVGQSLRKPEFAALYTREIAVIEQGRTFWLPVQSEVLSHLSKEAKPGHEFTAYLRYLGASLEAGGRLYLLIDFDANPPKALPRDICFSKQLFGITVGQPLAPVLKKMESSHGGPRLMRRGQQNLHVFLIDLESQTYVVVADAGEGYRDRVFSVQLTGSPDARAAVFKTLRFGAPSSEVFGILGKPTRMVDSGEGYTKLELPGSTCSVELRNGGLASILIADDPNYFAE
jgi:hypothetical protein